MHAPSIGTVAVGSLVAVAWRAGGDRDRRRRARAGRCRGRSSACRTRRSSAPGGRGRTCWLLVAIPCFVAAVALVPTLLRARAGVFAAALFVHAR